MADLRPPSVGYIVLLGGSRRSKGRLWIVKVELVCHCARPEEQQCFKQNSKSVQKCPHDDIYNTRMTKCL